MSEVPEYTLPKTFDEAVVRMRDDGDADPVGTAMLNYPVLFANHWETKAISLREAAPDMLAALEWVDQNPWAHPDERWDVVRDAIARARGAK